MIFPIPVSVHDDEAVVAPLHDEVGVQRDAEVLVVHLKIDNHGSDRIYSAILGKIPLQMPL